MKKNIDENTEVTMSKAAENKTEVSIDIITEDNVASAESKRTEFVRLGIFICLAFGISWIPAVVLNHTVGFSEWYATNKTPVLTWPLLFGPALANLLTRLVTKEGPRDNKLGLNLKGNVRCYVLAFFLATLINAANALFVTAVYGNGDMSKSLLGFPLKDLLPITLLGYVQAPLMLFITFGEEFGFRAYMVPKMQKLFGRLPAYALGGIIWGLWHTVLIAEGCYFGKDYPGFPYTGILLMCGICTVMGVFLAWLTERTNSVWPACIMLAMYRFAPTTIESFLTRGVDPDFSLSIGQQAVSLIPSTIVAVGVMMTKRKIQSNKKPR